MQHPKMSEIKTKSPYFIISCTLLVILIIALFFVPKSSWKNIFSGRFNMFAAAFSSTPNPDVYVITSGSTVKAIVPDHSGGAYIGGTFISFGLNVGPGVPVSSSTGVPVSTFPKVSGGNGNVNVSVQDGSGGWYIGGNFTKVGGVTRNYVAHILANGTLDTVFNPSATDINYEVLSMVFSTSTNRLYLGGQFTAVSGDFDRNYIAALNGTDGTLVPGFVPNATDYVRALALSPDGSTLYMGGSFNGLDCSICSNRSHIGAIDTVTGSTTSFDPGADNQVDALALSSDGSMLYVGGNFNTFGSLTRNYIAAYDTVAATTTSFDPDASAEVFALAFSPDQSILYLGGDFTTLAGGGTARNYIAAVSTTTALATSFDPDANFIVYAIAPSTDGNTVYLGGDFTLVNGVSRNRIAAVETSLGNVITAFNTNLNSTAVALALSSNGNQLYVGGYFNQTGIIAHNRLAHILSNGTVDQDFDPIVNNGSVNALALSPDGDTLYLGGTFTLIDGVSYPRLAAVNTADGVASTTFNPNVGNSEVDALALTSNGNTLYLVGGFTLVGGATYDRVAAVNTSDGVASTTFDPDVNGDVYALALSPDESTLYLGGWFNQVNGSGTRNNIAAVNTSTGLQTSFDPNTDNPVYALALSGNTIYLGGQFSQVGGGAVTRNRLAAYDILNATTTSFDPDLNDDVYTLALSGSTLYIGGPFTTINTNTVPLTRRRVAAVDTSNASTTSFDPNVGNNAVFTLAVSSDVQRLFMGGNFTTVGGVSQPRFASFPVAGSSAPAGRRRVIVLSEPPPENTATTSTSTATTTGGMSTTTATTTNITATTTLKYTFTRNLRRGDSSSDVKLLQQFLNSHGFPLANSGYGSSGEETNYFGPRTFNSVIRFQEANFDSILRPLNLTRGTGKFLEYSRARANQILNQ
jgi:hypothetical protein